MTEAGEADASAAAPADVPATADAEAVAAQPGGEEPEA